jgi:hypothetical protein
VSENKSQGPGDFDPYDFGFGDFLKSSITEGLRNELLRKYGGDKKRMYEDFYGLNQGRGFSDLLDGNMFRQPRRPEPEVELTEETAGPELDALIKQHGHEKILRSLLHTLEDMGDLASVVMVMRSELHEESRGGSEVYQTDYSFSGSGAGWSIYDDIKDIPPLDDEEGGSRRYTDFRQSDKAPKTPRSPRGRRR